MGVGSKLKLNDIERTRIEHAVDTAENHTGLQFLVYLGKNSGDPHKTAKRLLVKQGYSSVPGVLIFVAVNQRRIEVVTSEQARQRLSDSACEKAVEIMVPAFAQKDWITGVELGIAALSQEAGTGSAEAGTEELPDVLE